MENERVEDRQPATSPLDKHKHYKRSYKPDDVYWGLGIENETYIQILPDLEKPVTFLANRKRERYSVDYWTTYKPGVVEQLFQEHIDDLQQQSQCSPLKSMVATTIKLPRLLNAHSFDKTDRFGEPQKTYTAQPRANPKYSGETLFESLRNSLNKEVQTFFDENYGRSFCFDGDTIEFVTQNFYCTLLRNFIASKLTLFRYNGR